MKFRKILIISSLVLLIACGDESSKRNTNTKENAAKHATKGAQLFNNYCLQCHGLNDDKIGPKLAGVLARWDNDTSRIAAFIRNPQKVIASGDKRAVAVAKEWNYAMMTPMPHLSDAEINALLEYMAE